jgi:predicted NBD/HSP70 family sugar kinase
MPLGLAGGMPPGLAGGRTGLGALSQRSAAPRDSPDLHSVLAGPAVLSLAAEHGVHAKTPSEAVETAGAAFIAALAQRVALAAATVVAVLDPSLIVLTGAVGRAGGTRLRDAAAVVMRANGPLEAAIATSGVTDDPVLLGALDAGLDRLRDDLIQSVHDTRP